jgi:hypothetical protein
MDVAIERKRHADGFPFREEEKLTTDLRDEV